MKVLHQMTMYDPDEQSIVFQDTYPVPYLHRHREMQFVWVRKGHGNVIIGNHIQSFKPGEIYIVGANQPHLFKAADANQQSIGVLCLYIDHHKTFANVCDQIPEMHGIINFLKETDSGLQVPQRYVEAVGEEILVIKEKTGIERLIYFLRLIKMLMDINAWQDWKPLSSVLNNYSVDVSDRLNTIYRYSLDHYMDEISLEEVSSLACMTPNAFCAYFKKYTRKTYFAFLNDLRISEACKKLLSGEYSTIAAVAYASGFVNTITFNRVFRKGMGMTPSEYVDQFKVKHKAMPPFSPDAFF
ncbi:helix-turn-helix domain-containing protein [Parapedobacter tibetensis]|uniref:helix-turn-helix domain-containing protein n=1 Tax=Parapedobacter tibetensis TaxID=2972951 RepID=UPI00214D4FE7|nr:AraC family transcriptional regulator [Parapedobacter tibetensis]